MGREEVMLAFIVFLSVFIFCILAYWGYTTTKYKENMLRLAIQEKEAKETREKLLMKVKDKIECTQQSRHHKIKADDLMAHFIYKQDCVLELGEEMNEIYAKEYNVLRSQHPLLTDLDLLVLSLLANGMDNYDICALLKMEKRTLYRRRQLIAQRIGISSSSLDEFAVGFWNG